MSEDLSNDTIAAISTGLGESGIGIVRLSGKDALSIADRIFLSKDGKKPPSFKTYTTHYGWVIEKAEDYVVDEVILTVMRAPKSYTKEDVVEINCHGGIVALRKVLELVLDSGCRQAQPGEFTKRAFLNGRIDLTQAEAVLDIIKAKSDSALNLGAEQLKGVLSKKINKIRRALVKLLAQIEAEIDFPEEEIKGAELKKTEDSLRGIEAELKILLQASWQGRILREGINTVICGKPNVGKSSLLNTLLKQERSIVTSTAGTTRDTIEEIIDIKGIPMRIVDTAGIIEPKDIVERKAIGRSKKCIQLADLVILIFDASTSLSQADHTLIKKLKSKPTIAVINKIDLKFKINKDYLLKRFSRVVEISCVKNKNINLLEDAITGLIWQGKISPGEGLCVSNLRHIQLLKQAAKDISRSIGSLEKGLSFEFIAQDMKAGLSSLDKILGRECAADILKIIFSQFCIGK